MFVELHSKTTSSSVGRHLHARAAPTELVFSRCRFPTNMTLLTELRTGVLADALLNPLLQQLLLQRLGDGGIETVCLSLFLTLGGDEFVTLLRDG